jgi:hypothetical protein
MIHIVSIGYSDAADSEHSVYAVAEVERRWFGFKKD